MKKTIPFSIFLLLCLFSTAMLAQQVSVNYNHNATFSQYHTYAWGSDDKNKIQKLNPGAGSAAGY
jgi:hypothetical protein